MGAVGRPLELEEAVLIGDTHRDVEAGREAGCRTILVGDAQERELATLRAHGVEPDFTAPDARSAVARLLAQGEW